ncbi:MAG: NAD(P)-dependent oxidoreductase [Lachnospiraceae bacterium]|jgi:nucleoside-diphosphate-sugar epimerase|nr:NAD(P)-dependent oxidoreductase [Lachnospiraceae bacterium]
MDLYVISGVTGMTGNELARKQTAAGHRVIGFDNFFASSIETVEDLLPHELFCFHEYDLNCPEQMRQLKEQVGQERKACGKLIYINCAAVVHTEHFYHVNRTFETNVLGMKAFLDQAVGLHADIFINCSTSEVYSMNSWEEGGVSEADYITMANAEHSQRTSYAAGKLMTEFFMKDAVLGQKIKGCSIRFANVYSKKELYPKHIIPHILNQLKEHEGKVELLENSKVNYRTFLHNEDSCSAVIALIGEESALDGSVYNVATEEEISIIDLVKLCAEKAGIEHPQITFQGYRESDPVRRLLNTEKIRTRTGWKPCITLDRGIEMCLEENER